MKRILIEKMENILFKKMDDACMHDLVWCMNYPMYEFLLHFVLKTNLNCSPLHGYFKFMESFYFDIFLFFQIIFLV